MQDHKVTFSVFESSPGYYCCDVYRDDVRIVNGQAYSSPDTALRHRMENYLECINPEQFKPKTIQYLLQEMATDSSRYILNCRVERIGEMWKCGDKLLTLRESIEFLKGWQV